MMMMEFQIVGTATPKLRAPNGRICRRYLSPLERAEPSAERLLAADDDVTEHSQRDRQPHGGRVRRDGEVDVEQQVDDPAGRVSVARVRHGDAVEVDGVRQIGDHRQQVGHRERRQQVVRRRYLRQSTRRARFRSIRLVGYCW